MRARSDGELRARQGGGGFNGAWFCRLAQSKLDQDRSKLCIRLRDHFLLLQGQSTDRPNSSLALQRNQDVRETRS